MTELAEIELPQCGARHPVRTSIVCSLPEGHGPFPMAGRMFDHYSEGAGRAWILT